jgi:NADPH:quinone reductase-like Zn-dependent oxidoreductase
MKAIGVMTCGGPEVLRVFELPEPHAGDGEVRMRVHAASVNPTDTLFRAGSQAARLSGRPAPYVPGMDVAGVIDELGADADNRLKVGDRVVALVIPADPRPCASASRENLLRTLSKLPSLSLNQAAMKGPSTAMPLTNRRPGNSSNATPLDRRSATSASMSSTTQPHWS